MTSEHLSPEVEAAFKSWALARGVWPMLTHEEIFAAGMRASRPVSPTHGKVLRMGWVPSYDAPRETRTFEERSDGMFMHYATHLEIVESQAAKIAELQSQCDFFERTGKKFEAIIVELRQRNKELENKVGELPSLPPKDELRALRCDNRDLRSALKNIIEAYTEDKGPTEIARIARAALDTLPIPDFLRNQENLKAERAAVEPLGSRRMGNEPAGDGVTDDTAAIQAIVDGVLPRETGGSQS